ncbi:MAG: efflux transporter outer membrane subunit [Pseudomonadota bacterium]|nr:efflux transporter outer membrane subunit [Pseudomonadota bacterium]
MARIGCLVLLAMVTGGCTMGPDYVRPEVDSPERWRLEYTGAAGVVNTEWWKQFEDPVLDALIRRALLNNRDVRIAAGRVEEFAARLDISRSALFPQIGYDGAAGRNSVSRETAAGVPAGVDRVSDAYSATLNLGWELDFWGRIRRANEAARADLLATAEGRRTVILTLVSAVATSYITLRQLDKQLEISRRTLESRAESLRLFELQFQGGVVSELVLAQIRSEYEQAAAAIPVVERNIALAENALSILLGGNPGPIPRGKTIDHLALPAVPAGAPSELLTRRPDIRTAEQNLIAANALIGEARARYFPSISLTGLFGYASDDLSRLATGSANVWAIGAQAIGPIFTGGRISGQVRASEAVQRQTLEAYLQTAQTAFREVDDALISNQKAREELVVRGRRVDALKDYAHYAKLRFDNGYASYIEVLDAERNLFAAELDYARVQGEVYGSLTGIYKAMGGGWVLEAENVANEIDFATDEDARPKFRFPEPTAPATVGQTTVPPP